jgi:sulfonate transport system ATP-binding protein
MLRIEHVSKRFGSDLLALAAVDLTVEQGEFVAIVGGSGCGKSTLLRVIAGLETPSSGRVLIDGEAIAGPHPKIGIVFQEPRLLPWLTVRDNVAFGLSGLPRAERARRAEAALARVGLSEKGGVWPRQLSGGQAQRVAIARALVAEPEVILLDEPFSALDAFTRADLQDHLLEIWSGTTPRPTLIIVTHDVEEAILLAGRVLVMRPNPGRVAEDRVLDLARPRDRGAPGFESARRAILATLDHARPAPQPA